MGNFCCPPPNPCSHTVDETKGLLSSSESKNSTKADGTEWPAEVAEERKNEDEEPEPDKEVVTAQPNAINKPGGERSSYREVMANMHTEASRAAQASQSASPEMSKEPAVVAVEVAQAKDSAGPEEIQATAEDTALIEMVTAKEEETEPQTTDVPVKVDDAAGPPPAVAEASDVPIKKEAAEVEVNKEAAVVDTETEAAVVDTKTEAAVVDTKTEAAVVDTKKEEAVADIQEEDTKANVEKDDGVVEVEAAPVDLKRKATEVDTEKEAGEVDTMVAVAEVEMEKRAGELDSAEKPKTSLDVSSEKDGSPTKPQALTDSREDKHEVGGPAPTDVAQNHNKADTSMMVVEPRTSSPEPSSESSVVKAPVSAEVITEEPVGEPAGEVEDAASSLGEVKEVESGTQEHLEQVASPAVETGNELVPHSIENGQVEDLNNEDAVSETPQETELSQKIGEEPSCTESEAQPPETSADVERWKMASMVISFPLMVSTVQEEDKAGDAPADQEDITEPEEKGQESLLNGLDSTTTPPLEKSDSTELPSDAAQVESIEPTGPSEALPSDAHVQEKEEPEHGTSEKQTEKETAGTTSIVPLEQKDTESQKARKGEIILSSHAVEVALIPVSESITEQEKQQEDEDIYRGAEEIEKEPAKEKQPQPLLELTIPGVDMCSLAAAVDILAYSEREWKGNTAKSTLIKKGYSEMSCSFSSLRRVRGDNYCALRATLYQVLATTTQTPAWLLEEDFTLLPEKLEAQEHLIAGWSFPSECRKPGEKEDAVEKLKHYLELLQKRWQAAAETDSLDEKQRLCERVFQGGEEEYGLLEVLKFLMLARAVELHGQMQAGQEVPVFCWLLFARDTSENPRTLLSNHLSQIGFSGGLEQVEMFLLGYALQHTIQTFRLYMTDTEEFVTHYPDDHKQDWPCVCIVTEDDRHYNIPVRKRAQHQPNHNLSALWPHLS
ncbi:hypothetical protein NFI96_021228 [Prochilodus magdalenae]|nr:hypothetical protein NFI96_021228 [Prochilodus magdalenae]